MCQADVVQCGSDKVMW